MCPYRPSHNVSLTQDPSDFPVSAGDRYEICGLTYHSLSCPFLMTPALLELLPEKWAQNYHIFPLEADAHSITLASFHPLDPEVLEKLRFSLERTIHLRLYPKEKIETLIKEYYSQKVFDEDPQTSILSRMDPRAMPPPMETIILCEDDFSNNAVETHPVIQHVTMLLDEAIKKEASDLHIESFEHECRIRYRIDGLLCEKQSVPLTLAAPIMSRLKLLAQLDITECRLPQDGRLQHTWNKITVDFRLSSLPTQFGESLVLRLLDRRKFIRHISSLALPLLMEDALNQLLQKKNGLFIVTGPTGSGKTTTLYACLQELQGRHLKLITAEDPVEYEIEGIIQVPVQESIGRRFHELLRSFLRHDPDVIMIGETRDEETAQMAMQASLTGHFVMTTLHTNDAPGAITRLIDMGLDPLMISTTLEGILAQRLVRKLCPICRISYPIATFSQEELTFFDMNVLPPQLYASKGCDSCNHSGYQGRIAIFELLTINDELRLLINEKPPHYQLRTMAAQHGMISLRIECDRYVREGITTVHEINRLMHASVG